MSRMSQFLRRVTSVLSWKPHVKYNSPSITQGQPRMIHKHSPTTSLVIKPPFTYQPDVGLSNLQEIIDLIHRDPTCHNNQYNSRNIIAAMTTFCETEYPWWTARDTDGTALGFVLATHVGDTYSRLSNLYVAPEARWLSIAQILFETAAHSIDSNERSSQCSTTSGGLTISKKCFPDMKIDVDRNLSVCCGVPKFKPKLIPEDDSDFQIIPNTKNHLLEDIVDWDKVNIHETVRPRFWEVFLEPSLTASYVAVDNITKDVLGFSAIQPSFDDNCQIIGPLYADNDKVALLLFRHVMNHYIPGKKIMVTYHEKNDLMNSLCTGMSMPKAEPVWNYYTKHPFQSTNKKYWKKMYMSASNGITQQ